MTVQTPTLESMSITSTATKNTIGSSNSYNDKNHHSTAAAKRRRNVCLFGTSANPPTGHQGHVGIVRALSHLQRRRKTEDLEEHSSCSSYKYDEIRVVPVYSHPFSSKRKQLADFAHRKNMCRLAFDGIERVTIDESERLIYQQKQEQKKQLEENDVSSSRSINSNNNTNSNNTTTNTIRVGTADLLEFYLQHDAAHGIPNDYTLCLGADTFLDLTGGKWRRTQEILNAVQGRFVVLYRDLIDKKEATTTTKRNTTNNTTTTTNASSSNSSSDDEQQSEQEEEEPSQRERLVQAIANLEGIYGPDSIQLLQVPHLGAVSSTLVRKMSSELSLQSSSIGEGSKIGDTASSGEDEWTDEELMVQQQETEERLKQMVLHSVLEYMKEHQLYGIRNDEEEEEAVQGN